ncbi:uncharacterized protein [Diabrotica undecimpunctata]|uniref:uncharacterized protein n=1 Tax=Diabrotica undecimpunctata TaxID=50387 RepID=UPI003B640D56
MAVDEKEDFKGRRRRHVKHAPEGDSGTGWKPAFPVNVTVDELYLYRKKKHTFDWLKDNIQIEEGSFKNLKSEYRRRFKNFYEILKSLNENEKDLLDVEPTKQEVLLNLAGAVERKSEYNESFNRNLLQRPSDTYGIMNEVSDNQTSNRPHPFGNELADFKPSKRPPLLKRPTNLKIEGDCSHITEHADKFIEYLLAKRAELCRTPTTLKLGTGEMESKTETTDQFRKYENSERPSLIRKFTNLQLESGLDVKTEQQEKFMQYEIHSRPPLVKKSTNLHLEGDFYLVPEYRHQYIQYENVTRAGPVLPAHNFKSAGLFENSSDQPTNLGRSSPLIPFLRESYSYHDFENDKKSRTNVCSSRYQSNVSLNRTSSHPNLSKPSVIEENSPKKNFKVQSPQKNAYLDLNKNRSTERRMSRRDIHLNTMEKYGTLGLSNTRYSSGKYLDPENSKRFGESSVGRSHVRKPQDNFINEGEVNYLTEKHDKFVHHPDMQKRQLLRRKSEQIFDYPDEDVDSDQAFDGRFECQPEYRRALIDYLIREKPPPGQRRRILEIPDITINSDHNVDETPSSADNPEKSKTTSPKVKRPQSSVPKPSSVPSSPKTTSAKESSRPLSREKAKTLMRPKRIKTETVRLSPESKKRVFRRSSTRSPVPGNNTGKISRESSPSLGFLPPKSAGNWRRNQLKPSSSVEANIWNSTETDPAFFVVNDRIPSRSSIRQNLYKEQRWMPSWYNGGV